MPAILVLARVWSLHVALLIAGIEGLVAAAWWRRDSAVPTIGQAVPLRALLPAALVLSLSWMLVERWPQQMRRCARCVGCVRLARFAAALLITVAPALVAGRPELDHEPASVTAIGIGLAGALAGLAGRWLWAPLAVAAYGWLQYAARRPPQDLLAHDTLIALAVCILGACAYAFFPISSRRHRPSVKPSRRLR